MFTDNVDIDQVALIVDNRDCFILFVVPRANMALVIMAPKGFLVLSVAR